MSLLNNYYYYFFNTASHLFGVFQSGLFSICEIFMQHCDSISFARFVCIASSNASFALDFSLVYGVQCRSITIAFRS